MLTGLLATLATLALLWIMVRYDRYQTAREVAQLSAPAEPEPAPLSVLSRIVLTYTAAREVWFASEYIMSYTPAGPAVLSAEPREPEREPDANQSSQLAEPSTIELERRDIVRKLLVDKKPPTATDLATLRDMRYQQALGWINGIIDGNDRSNRSELTTGKRTS